MQKKHEPRIRQILFDDVKNQHITKNIRRDYATLSNFMISEDKKAKLENMNSVKRFFVHGYWLMRALIINLTPARRVLLVLALILFFLNNQQGTNVSSAPLGGMLLLLFILMLELKDKLLALRELEAGHGVQKGLMPEETPRANGWELWLFSRPANEVCGDFVDFLAFDENTSCLSMGDVSGKGLGAALLGTRLQATIRALATPGIPFTKLGEQLNGIFTRDNIPGMFASLIYVEMQAGGGDLRVLNAGHIPPVVITRDGVRKMEKGSAALGLSHSMTYTEQTLSVGDDELVLIYTDGLTEAVNEAGDFIGEEKLLHYLPRLNGMTPKEAGDSLLAAIDYFIGDADPADDLTMVFLRRKAN